jgi:arsenate reductase
MLPAEVQILGSKKNPITRKALRFFAERRIRTHFVDFAVRAPSRGELRRFAERFGIAMLIDQKSRPFFEQGLAHAARSESWWLEKLSAEPALLVMPLVRYGNRLTIGDAEPEWREWLASTRRT